MASTSLLSFATLTLITAASGCVDESAFVGETRKPIINGEVCDSGEMPTTVALLIDATVDFSGKEYPIRTLVCTGTLIAPDTVLTAAHCVDDAVLTGGFGTVVSKTHYISRTQDLRQLLRMDQTLPALPSDARPVRSVVKHESFTLDVEGLPAGLSQFYDIGLVFLEEPIANLEPAIVMTPEEAKGLGVGIDVQIAGWGQQTIDSNGPSGTKHCATAQIFEINDFEMQIGNEPSTARKCRGDSGGPTMITISTDSRRKDRVIGATSRAYDSSNCGKGGVDTLASAYYQWIDDKMSERCDVGQRAWCEVPGIVAPGFYDDREPQQSSESGGCNSGGPAGGFASLLLLCAFAWIRRSTTAS